MIISGKNLAIIDDSELATYGRVTLETMTSFSCVSYMILVQSQRVLGNTDNGFQIEVTSRFKDSEAIGEGLAFNTPETIGYAVTKFKRRFARGTFNIFYPVEAVVNDQFVRVAVQWFGNHHNPADVTISLYPESRI